MVEVDLNYFLVNLPPTFLTTCGVFRVFRIVRILRIFKLVEVSRELTVIVEGLVASMKGMFWVGILFVMIVYASAMPRCRMGGRDRALFQCDSPHKRSVSRSIRTLPPLRC